MIVNIQLIVDSADQKFSKEAINSLIEQLKVDPKVTSAQKVKGGIKIVRTITEDEMAYLFNV